MRVTVLGTGLMGAPMARNIAADGHDVTVWNRSPEKAKALSDVAPVTDTAAAAVEGAQIIVSMMSDGAATASVLDDALGAVPEGAVWIEMASVRPADAVAQADRLAAVGARHLDAPVSGGTKGAEDATLAIMVGGAAEDLDTARPVLEAMGRPVHVGPSGTGQLAKLANQAIVGVTIGAVAEAILLVDAAGGDADAFRAALKGGFADSTILQQHGARMTRGDFVPGGPVKHHLKDLTNAAEAAAGADLSLPLTDAVRARFARLVDRGQGDLDHSALYLDLLDLNGRTT